MEETENNYIRILSHKKIKIKGILHIKTLNFSFLLLLKYKKAV